MAWELDLFDDGDALDSTNLNAPFAAGKVWADATDRTGWRKGMFNHHHGATCLRIPGNIFVGGDESGNHVYDEATFTTSLQYATFGADGGTDLTANNPTGQWTILGHPDQTGAYTGGKAELVWSGFRVGMQNELDKTQNVSGIEILFNCEVVNVDDGEPGETGVSVVFCIQYEINSVWRTLNKTQRFISIENRVISTAADNLWIDCPIRTVLTPDDIDLKDPGLSQTTDITGLRAMVSKRSTGGSGNVSITLGQWNLTALPWRAEDVA